MRSFLTKALAVIALTAVLAGCGGAKAPATTQAPAAKGPDFPTKQISYLLAFDPGGPSDREARRQQPLLEKSLGQKVIVDYKAGGGGALGWAELVRAKPDGYTIGGINVPHIVLQPLQQQTGYKTEDMIPVAIFQRTPIGLAVQKDSPYKTLDDLIKAAKANPGTITISGSGTFTGYHFATARLEKLTGAKFKYVPFNGNAPAMTALLGGQTVATFNGTDDLVKYGDKVRVLAMADEKRFPNIPETPTFKELKFDLVEVVDRGVAVPKGTPKEVIKKLEDAFLAITKDPAVAEQMRKEGYVPMTMGSEESQAYINKLIPQYKALIEELNKK